MTNPPADIGPRNQEQKKIHLEDVRYIIAEDDESTRELYKIRFQRIGMEHQQGSFGSVEETLDRIKRAVEQGECPHLLVLDKDFFVDKGHSDRDRNAALILLKKFEEYKQSLQGDERELADQIKTVLLSGSVEKGDLEKMQELSSSFLGILEKPNSQFHLCIAGMLGEAGIVEENDQVKSAIGTLNECRAKGFVY